MSTSVVLPGLNCGLCGYPTCEEFSAQLALDPELLKHCPNRSDRKTADGSPSPVARSFSIITEDEPLTFRDREDREVDFYVDTFKEDPGPREDITLFGGMLAVERLKIAKGDVLLGRPLGVSCGCPVLHIGEVMNVDADSGVITWCIVGPRRSRTDGFKNVGPYSAQAYEGVVRRDRSRVQELKLGMRYHFLPGLCMMQWRHRALLNAAKRTDEGWQVRLEGIWIE